MIGVPKSAPPAMRIPQGRLRSLRSFKTTVCFFVILSELGMSRRTGKDGKISVSFRSFYFSLIFTSQIFFNSFFSPFYFIRPGPVRVFSFYFPSKNSTPFSLDAKNTEFAKNRVTKLRNKEITQRTSGHGRAGPTELPNLQTTSHTDFNEF